MALSSKIGYIDCYCLSRLKSNTIADMIGFTLDLIFSVVNLVINNLCGVP